MCGAKLGFLPVSREDLDYLGWDYIDFLFVTGDAYVDHPSFGHAIISRVLTANGYRVGIIAQPDKTDIESFKKLGKPRLGVLISAGNLDSMVCHYTASKKPRSDDMYSPGGKAGTRPDRATIVYANKVREAFGDVPIIIGGIEASLRRFAHYDYWDNRVRRSILIDSRSDILIYGMGEKQIVEIADALDKGVPVKKIRNVKGTCYIAKTKDELPNDAVFIPSFEECRDNKLSYAKAEKKEHDEQDPYRGKAVIQKHIDKFLVQNPPAMPLTTKELDAVYELPYVRNYHPMYEKMGGIPAISEVKFSITSVRGCFGSCNFCALTFHQGRIIQARSHESIIREAEIIASDPDFKGCIHDVGGPTANFRFPACKNQNKNGACKGKQCLFPKPCGNMEISHTDYLTLLRKLRKIQGVKKVFVRSGIRYDYLIHDKNDEFFKELIEHHVSGQLKVAPEHISKNVLYYMGKPNKEVYDRFSDKFYKLNEKIGKKQFLVPYLMSSHPGSTLKDAIELSLYLKEHKLNPQQVQDFYPTPGTLSTCMFYTGIDPRTMKEVFVPKDPKEKAMQRALLQYKNPENVRLVREALKKAGREDLIGYAKECLVRPEREEKRGGQNKNGKNLRRKSSISENKRGTKTRGRKPKK